MMMRMIAGTHRKFMHRSGSEVHDVVIASAAKQPLPIPPQLGRERGRGCFGAPLLAMTCSHYVGFNYYAVFLCALLLLLLMGGCGKPGDSEDNLTNSVVTITSINNNEPLQSDVLTNGYGTDDVVSVKLKSDFRAPEDDPTAPKGPTVFDTIVFYSYHVTHMRSDGGPNPSEFTGGMNVTLTANSEGEASIVVVRAFDKNRSPLEELRDDGEIFTTSIITFYGTDGNGNDIAMTGSLAISFANFPDQ